MEEKTLRLFDVSQYIASGSKNIVISDGVIMDGGKFRSKDLPVGGLSYLLNVVHEYQNDNTDLVFCCDRPPRIKRRIHEQNFPYYHGYKGNRPMRDESITIQRQLAEEVLRDCGFNVLAVEDVEADDIIASLVKYYKDSYDHIYIHSLDSDLFYLVCDNVEIVPMTEGYYSRGVLVRRGKHITMQNWENEVDKDYVIPYDTLTIQKMCKGESGDNIPSVTKEMGDRIVSSIPKDQYVKCGDNEFLKKWIMNAVNGDKKVEAVFDLIAPIIIPYSQVELGVTEYRKDVYEYYAYILQNKYYKTCNSTYTKAEELVGRYIDEYNRR